MVEKQRPNNKICILVLSGHFKHGSGELFIRLKRSVSIIQLC